MGHYDKQRDKQLNQYTADWPLTASEEYPHDVEDMLNLSEEEITDLMKDTHLGKNHWPLPSSHEEDVKENVKDVVNNPNHYTSHPSGIECIQVTEHMSFCIGNAFKYLWRYELKNGEEDLKKAMWYIQRELDKGGT